ncbi:MAG TPA: DUF3369 domain-containing protein [Candidatus Competibacteraceae bacterium]|nr:MAG: DUF3369 domain-containing protein [Candidatus Competibacteraceae bacterium]HOB62401.1 DUF3369 domain-containing protein [Candidatus Competibacteraceae bacterium]HQA26792.1 DUF3369 domain-containing protein [Candidatus Competibacteraceae bacterium]HQD56858.1 DUF3369 domain-containing protein [Candidatus Competibacteraceae bacterium]
MKIIKKVATTAATTTTTPSTLQLPPWKVLVVDDEEDVHKLTELNLRNFSYSDRGLRLLKARSAHEAKTILDMEHDIALALIDVVMESDDAGLKLVDYIRNSQGNQLMRLHIRTGQAGTAPERYVIDHFDIDGYTDKTEITAQRLYTLVRTGIKSYQDLRAIDLNRLGLSYVLASTQDIYAFRQESIEKFFQGVLTQIIGLLRLGESSLITTTEGMIVTIEGEQIEVQAGTGAFNNDQTHLKQERTREISQRYGKALAQAESPLELSPDTSILPLKIKEQTVGFIYLEHTRHLSATDRNLLNVLANQCASALESLRLHLELTKSYDHIVDILAHVAEYKDSTTGNHINRVARLVELIALEMGFDPQEALRIGKASRLHDVGKIGIPDHILQKSGHLTNDEFAIIKTHTQIGANLLQHDRWLELSQQIAISHHERWDGGGYPTGLRGEEIPLTTRIVSVADVYDALVHSRSYKNAWPVAEAVAYLEAEKARHFDPAVVDAFLRLFRRGECPSSVRVDIAP